MSVPTLILKWCLANKINSRTFFDKSLARELLSLLSLLKVRDVADLDVAQDGILIFYINKVIK